MTYWNDLLNRVLGTIQLILCIKTDNVEKLKEYYEYCHGPLSITRLRDNIRNKREIVKGREAKHEMYPVYLAGPSMKTLYEQAEFYGELVSKDLAIIDKDAKYKTVRDDYPLLKILLTRIQQVNVDIQRILHEMRQSEEEKTKERNYKKKLRENKQDYDKWKHISFDYATNPFEGGS